MTPAEPEPPNYSESANTRPGEPLREWGSGEPVARIDAELVIKSAGAAAALRKLVQGEPVTVDDEAIFGRLNSWCVQMWYEPMVVLIKRPQISAAVRALLESTKVLRDNA